MSRDRWYGRRVATSHIHHWQWHTQSSISGILFLHIPDNSLWISHTLPLSTHNLADILSIAPILLLSSNSLAAQHNCWWESRKSQECMPYKCYLRRINHTYRPYFWHRHHCSGQNLNSTPYKCHSARNFYRIVQIGRHQTRIWIRFDRPDRFLLDCSSNSCYLLECSCYFTRRRIGHTGDTDQT